MTEDEALAALLATVCEYTRRYPEEHQLVPTSWSFDGTRWLALSWDLMLLDREGTPIDLTCNCDVDSPCNAPYCVMSRELEWGIPRRRSVAATA